MSNTRIARAGAEKTCDTTLSGCQHLQSARCHQLSVSRVCDSTFGTRPFSVAGLRVWNSLPGHLQDPPIDPKQFGRDLKTYLFAGHQSISTLALLHDRTLQIIDILLYITSTMNKLTYTRGCSVGKNMSDGT